MERTRGGFDLAYGCFLVGGIGALVINWVITSASPIATQIENTATVIFFVLVPLTFLWLVALALGVVLTGLLWKDWGLVALSGISLLFLSVAAAAFQNVRVPFFSSVALAYGLGALAIGGAWFLTRRRRRFPAAATFEP